MPTPSSKQTCDECQRRNMCKPYVRNVDLTFKYVCGVCFARWGYFPYQIWENL